MVGAKIWQLPTFPLSPSCLTNQSPSLTHVVER